MACPSVITGGQFLVQTLSHLDCQAQSLGSFGFQSLAVPGSPAMLMLTGLLTLFIALFAIRLLGGEGARSRDALNAALKVGIVITLAVSWPAFRVLAYDTVLLGPTEIASSIAPATMPNTTVGFTQRLQGIDTGIASLTLMGTGSQTGSLALEARGADAFKTIAVSDATALGWARVVYLASVTGSLAILRIAGGLLLALTPLMAGLLLFDFARGIFAGWLRGLVLVALGSLGITMLLATEVAVVEPWLADILQRRNLGYATPSAPTELLALTVAFALASIGLLIVLGKVAFQNGWATRAEPPLTEDRQRWMPMPSIRPTPPAEVTVHSRALRVGEGVSNLIRHEETRRGAQHILLPAPVAASSAPQAVGADPAARLGSSWRRTTPRATAAQAQRDKRP